MEIPQEWKEVPDLMMEEGDILPGDTRPDKRKRDETRAEKTKEGLQYLDRETRTFSHSISEDTKFLGILFQRMGHRQTRGR